MTSLHPSSSLPFPEGLPPFAGAKNGPEPLTQLLEQLQKNHRDQDIAAYSSSLRDSLGFLVRYFAGCTRAAIRVLKISDDLPQGVLNVEDSSQFLEEWSSKLQAHPSSLAQKLSSCLCDPEGNLKPFASKLLKEKAAFNFCKQEPRAIFPSEVEQQDPQYIKKLTPAYRSYLRGLVKRYCSSLQETAPVFEEFLENAQGWFGDCEHRFEPGQLFGQVELVLVFQEYLLATGLNMRMLELRSAPASASLIGPDDHEDLSLESLLAMLPQIPTDFEELQKPEDQLGPVQQDPQNSQLLLNESPAAYTTEQTAPATPEPEESKPPVELLEFIQNRLKEGPTAKTRKSQAKKVEYTLLVEVEQAGIRKNPQGKLGYFGFLWVRVGGSDELELEGSAECLNGSVQLDPPNFFGQGSRISYWIDPEVGTSPRGQIVISARALPKNPLADSQSDTPENEKAILQSPSYALVDTVALWRCVPESPLAALSDQQIWGGLLAPPLIAGCYTAWVFFSTAAQTLAVTQTTLASQYARLTDPTSNVSLSEAGVGFLELKVHPQIEAALLLFFLYAWLSPIASVFVFGKVPHHRKPTVSWAWSLAPILPSLFYLALWKTPLTSDPLFLHPEFQIADFRSSLSAFILLNVSAACFVHLWQAGWFSKYLNNLGRAALWLLMIGLCSMYTFVMVYARSWFF